MYLFSWLNKIKLMLNSQLTYKYITNEYRQLKQRKAAEEVQCLKRFTQWPIAKEKSIPIQHKQKSNLKVKHISKNNKLHYLHLPSVTSTPTKKAASISVIKNQKYAD
jgi:hypothetical protein